MWEIRAPSPTLQVLCIILYCSSKFFRYEIEMLSPYSWKHIARDWCWLLHRTCSCFGRVWITPSLFSYLCLQFIDFTSRTFSCARRICHCSIICSPIAASSASCSAAVKNAVAALSCSNCFFIRASLAEMSALQVWHVYCCTSHSLKWYVWNAWPHPGTFFTSSQQINLIAAYTDTDGPVLPRPWFSRIVCPCCQSSVSVGGNQSSA